MKNLLFIFFLGLSVVVNAQTAAKDLRQLKDLVELGTKNLNNNVKLDSITIELDKLYEIATDPTIRRGAKDLSNNLKDLRNVNFTAKPVTVNFESLDKDLQKKFSYDNDKFKEASFLEAKKSYSDKIKLYITITDKTARLRFKTKYIGNGWLFFDKAIFNIEGENYEYNSGDMRRDVISGSNVKESSDVAVDEKLLILLKAISNAKSPIDYRLTGDKYQDFKLTEREKENIILTLSLYNELTK